MRSTLRTSEENAVDAPVECGVDWKSQLAIALPSKFAGKDYEESTCVRTNPLDIDRFYWPNILERYTSRYI